MTDKQRSYIESLIKKVFRNEDSRNEILSRLSKASVSSSQASTMIHALRLEYNIYQTIPSCMFAANNLNPKMDLFFRYLGFDKV